MYEFQVDIRLDGKYYCRIYQHGIPGTIANIDDYVAEQDAIEAAEEIIRRLRVEDNELSPL